jgi:DNA-binding Xre family transcriptional regulator
MAVMQEALGIAAVTLGIGERISKIKEMISSSVDLDMEIGHLSEKTGISTQTLSGLKDVSDATGVAFESLQRASKKTFNRDARGRGRQQGLQQELRPAGIRLGRNQTRDAQSHPAR